MLYKYLLEIKNRIILVLSAWLLTMFTCYFYKNILLFLLIKINFKLYNLELFYFIATNLSDMFFVCLQLVHFVSFHCLIFLIIYHTLSFLAPGLFKFEYKKLILVIYISLILFVFSIILLHSCILPFLWDFFLTFQTNCGINVFFESKITEYFIFYKEIYFLTILIGQIFAAILLNIMLVKKKIDFIHKSRKLLYFTFILISTVITPPDVISQIIVGINFIVFYELIVLTIFFKKHT